MFLFAVILVRCLVIPFLAPKAQRLGLDSRRYPHLDPWLGIDLAIRSWRDFNTGRLSEGLRERHLSHGSTFITKNLGADCIYTLEPDNIRWITTKGFENFGKSGWVGEAAKHIGNGILMNDGEAWKRSRRMLKPIFARTAIDEPALLEPHVQKLVASMRRRSRESGAFDFHELACMFTLDVVTEFLFGRSTSCLEGPGETGGREGLHFLALVKDFEGPSARFIALGPLAWFSLLWSYQHLIGLVEGLKAFFRAQLNGIIAETCTDASQKLPAKADVSLSVFRAMKAAGISDGQIQGELQNIFFASYDTTSAFVANLMYVLVRHPDIQQRLRDEIEFLRGRPPSGQDLSELHFLRLVLMEGSYPHNPDPQTPISVQPRGRLTGLYTALRLYSPVSSHSRTAKVTTTLPRGGGTDGLGPVLVRAGATVVWSTYALNRDPQRYGEDWAEFRPDRWTSLTMRSKDTATPTWASGPDAEEDGGTVEGDAPSATEIGASWRGFFMPFGSGPRACLGQQMVQNETMCVVVRLLQEFPIITMDAAEHGKAFKEAKAVSFYNDGGVRICVN